MVVRSGGGVHQLLRSIGAVHNLFQEQRRSPQPFSLIEPKHPSWPVGSGNNNHFPVA